MARILAMKIYSLILFLTLLSQYSFCQNWEGHGEGLSYMIMTNGYIAGVTCESELNIQADSVFVEGLNFCHHVDKETGEIIYPAQVHVYGDKIDSVIIQNLNGTRKSKFYSIENYSIHSIYHFRGMELEIWDDDFIQGVKYQINRYGIFNKSDENFETEIQKTLSSMEMDSLVELIKKIDVKSLNDCPLGYNTSSHANNYIYTFYNGLRQSYKLRTQTVPIKLEAITSFIRGIK